MAERKIESKLVDYIDKKLEGNLAFQNAIEERDARRVMIFASEALLGVREATGRNDGPMVKLIQETVGGASGEAWCLAFVQSCIAYAEVKTGLKSPIVATEHCWTAWHNTPKAQRVKTRPSRGVIAIWNYPPTKNGHTGIVDEYEHKLGKMMTLEGNTMSGIKKDGTIERDGGGSYRCERSTSGNKKMELLGFLRPF